MSNQVAPPGSANAAGDLPTGPAMQAELQNPELGLPESFGTGLAGRLLFWIAVAFSTFQVVTAFGVPLDRPLVSGITLIHLTSVVFALWAGWLVVGQLRNRATLEGWLAFACLLVTFLIVLKFAGSLPSQVVRTLHVGFLTLVAAAMLANHRRGKARCSGL